MRAVPALPAGFSLDAYRAIAEEITNIKLANILRTRVFLIAQMYPAQIQQKKSFWEILILSNEEKREISDSIQGTPLLEDIRKLLSAPLTPQIIERVSSPTPQSASAQIGEVGGVTGPLEDFAQIFQNDPIHINKYKSLRDLQLGDAINFSEQLCFFTKDELQNEQMPLKEFLLATNQNRPPECYPAALGTKAFAVVDLTRPETEIRDQFSAWLSDNKKTLGRNAKSTVELRSLISDNNLLAMIDLGILIGPANQLFYSKDDLVSLLPKRGNDVDFIDASRMQARDIGKSINRILDINSINQLYAA